MKIAVYTIAKNEEQFVDRWAESCADADFRLIADTGSTDLTRERAQRIDNVVLHNIHINPWRFEDARNASLALLPSDIDVCIALDMDEVLTPGWRKIVEDAYRNNPDLDRLRYNYVWSWEEQQGVKIPGLTYYADKIHTRKNYRWVHPVHEVLRKDSRAGAETQMFVDNTLIEHHPDHTKSRSSYLGLLELSVRENPHDDRNAHYYARELLSVGRYEEAIAEFNRHLDLPSATWLSERAASLRFLGDCYWALGDTTRACQYFEEAIRVTPNEREGYVALAQAHRALGNWQACLDNCLLALAITERPNSYINQAWAWGSWPQTMANQALEKLGLPDRLED